MLLQVENIVGIELAYINTKHPDFHEAQMVHKAVTNDQEGIKQLQKEMQHKNYMQQIDEKENRVIKKIYFKFFKRLSLIHLY